MFLQIWDDIAIDYAKDPGRLERLKEAVRQLEESGEITEEIENQESDVIESNANTICQEDASADVVPELKDIENQESDVIDSDINTICQEESSAGVVLELSEPPVHPTMKPATCAEVCHMNKLFAVKISGANISFICECSTLPCQKVWMSRNEAIFRQISFPY